MSICPYVRSLSTDTDKDTDKDTDMDTDMNMDIRTYEHGHVAVMQDWTILTGHFRRLFTLDVLSHYTFCPYSLRLIRRFVLIRFDILYLMSFQTFCLYIYVLSHYTFCHYTFVGIYCVFRRFVVIRSVTGSMVTVWPKLTTARRLSSYV